MYLKLQLDEPTLYPRLESPPGQRHRTKRINNHTRGPSLSRRPFSLFTLTNPTELFTGEP